MTKKMGLKPDDPTRPLFLLVVGFLAVVSLVGTLILAGVFVLGLYLVVVYILTGS